MRISRDANHLTVNETAVRFDERASNLCSAMSLKCVDGRFKIREFCGFVAEACLGIQFHDYLQFNIHNTPEIDGRFEE